MPARPFVPVFSEIGSLSARVRGKCGWSRTRKGPLHFVVAYAREVVAEVLAANDIVQIIGPHVELKGAGGGRKKGLCPFHQEKTPSFVVSQDRQSYHCFGCGKGGDALSFVMEHEGLHFLEALQQLADRANITLPARSAADSTKDGLRKQLLEFNRDANRFFRKILQHPERGRAGRAYLATRKLNESTVEHFGLGMAPDDWGVLRDGARRKGTPDAVLQASGLIKRNDSGHEYDAFRNRLMFPIKDVAGNVVAFGGRALDDNPAKYINSPETQCYRKSRVLYALHEAREAMKREKYAILVEGYFDVLRCFDAGIENAVAACGTALTAEQAGLLKRYVPEVVLVYDGDAAGIQAAMKSTGVLTAAGLAVRAMALPGGQDPDDFIRDAGPEAFLQQVSAANDFVTFYARQSEARLSSIEGRTEVAHEIFDILRHIDDAVRLDEYLKLAARQIGLNEWACRREFEHYITEGRRAKPPVAPEPEDNGAMPSKDDCDFVAALLQNPAQLDKARGVLEDRLHSLPGALGEVLGVLFAGAAPQVNSDFNTETARRLYSAATTYDINGIPEPAELVAKRLNRLEKEALRVEAAEVMNQIQEMERAGDMDRLVELLQRKMQLGKQLERVGAY